MYQEIYNFLNECEQNESIKNISFGIVNENEVLYQMNKKPYQIDQPRIMFSITKSFTGLAIGMLLDDGLINLDDKVSKYFKDYFPKILNENLEKMTIRHLLSMSSGLKYENFKDALVDDDFIKTFFSREFVNKPGSKYLYSTRTSHILSALVRITTGKTLQVFLDERLFKPLEITNYFWEETPEGNSYGGSGLAITHDAMAKLGILLLNDGVYKGKRIVSKAFLDEATKSQVIKQDSVGTEASKSRGISYGYQFHIVNENEYAADGMFGQVIYVFKDLKIAIILTSQTTDFVKIYALIQKHFRNFTLSNDINKDQLDLYVKTLTYEKESSNVVFKHDLTFKLDKNSLKVNSVRVNKDFIEFTHDDESVDRLNLNERIGYLRFIRTINYERQKVFLTVLASSEDKLVIELTHLESPFISQFIFEKRESESIFRFEPIITFYLDKFEQPIRNH
ncbi:serine hydrolase domain-containing protein [Acholeplasma hippikon]|uniref:D-alanyl-D-alanine carboxypeptidase n=1 Tax=Acholeplasma hippikon TaxID=264636 RepID=A0A449BIK1_9MOLU|nr:serine hydrolase [Acholeplasma hippikon]VEU82262.1 D-alanyl-D-alanine carboxypeptidase precursor [Acholeplasma hippikon]